MSLSGGHPNGSTYLECNKMNSDSTPSYTFDWRFQEHARISTFLFRDLYRGIVWRVLGWTLVALVTLLFLFAAFIGELAVLLLKLAPWLLQLLIWWVLVRSGIGWLLAWRIRRLDPNVSHPHIHTIAQSGLKVQLHTADMELRWSGMFKVRELPDFFLFYYSKRSAYYLPKRSIGDPKVIDQVRVLIRERLPDSVPFIDV